jgi:hypothetical protein
MTSVGVIFIFKKSRRMKIWNFPVQVQTSQLSRLFYSPVVDPANLPRSLQIGLAELPVMLGPIYVIGGLLCWHTYVIQVVKLTKVFGGVLLSMCCIMMGPTKEPPKICY